MKKILVCQHVPYEILGTLNPLFKSQGCRIRYLNFGRHPDAKISLEGYHGLVILGGPMNVDQESRYPHLTHEMELIEQALKKDLPILGICLGAQLIAKVLGAEVRPNSAKEIGWHPVDRSPESRDDPVFAHFAERENLFHWHSQTFDLPSGAAHLASSQLCANQAFRHGDKVYGFQFHLEVDEPMVERWLIVPYHQQELEQLKGRVDPEEIRRLNRVHMQRLNELSRKTFGEFIKLLGIEKKFRLLPSR
jgi:GMP synthase (glutamine-hydrolysing)